MRKLLALGCCAAYLTFGLLAGTAHTHGAADHHSEMRGLHTDHAHLGESDEHGPAGHHSHVVPGKATPNAAVPHVDARHVGHHDNDHVDLTATALTLDTGLRAMPAAIAGGVTVAAPALVWAAAEDRIVPLRGPPGTSPSRPRAPPA